MKTEAYNDRDITDATSSIDVRLDQFPGGARMPNRSDLASTSPIAPRR